MLFTWVVDVTNWIREMTLFRLESRVRRIADRAESESWGGEGSGMVWESPFTQIT